MIRILMLLTLGATTLAFGGTPDWARNGVILVIGGLSVLAGIMQFRNPAQRFTKLDLFAAFSFIIVCAWIYFQSTAGSAAFIPGANAAQDMRTALGVSATDTISVLPHLTREALIWILAMGAWFMLSLMTSQRHDSFSQIGLWSIVGLAVTFAFYGLMLRALGLEVVLWHEKEAYLGTLTGPFINRNHFATFLAIGLVSATALLFEIRSRPAAQARAAAAGVSSTATGMRWDRLIALAICWAVLGTALVLTQSRGGIGSAAFGMALVIGSSVMLGSRGLFAGMALAIMIAIGAAGLFAINSETLSERFYFADWALEGRFALYSYIWETVEKYPWTGTGLGTFEAVFRMTKPDVIVQYFDYAHNSYLEFAFEIGIPATMIMMGLFGLYMLVALFAVRTLRQKPAVALAAVGASGVIAMHALVDFSMQIPAVTMTYLFLMGSAIGQARISARS